MQHTFRATMVNPTHRRISDGVTGILRSFSDTVKINPPSAKVAAEGYEAISDTPASPEVPSEVSSWRAKAVLSIAGLLPQVEAALANIPGDAGIIARLAWENNAPLLRHGPTVTALAPQLGLNDEQVDALFIQSAQLEV